MTASRGAGIPRLEVLAIPGIGEIEPGMDLAAIVHDACTGAGLSLDDGDILVVTHKIVSKAEGRIVPAVDDAEYRSIVEAEAAVILRRRDDLAITRTSHGFICANAGVDRSNAPPGHAVLLPRQPDRSAHRLRDALRQRGAGTIAVVITDTFGRPWRRGLTDVAIGIAGMPAIVDLRGTTDASGRPLDVTEIALVDEVAAAADLVMGKATGIPAAIVRGVTWPPGEGSADDLVRPVDEDLFR